MKAFILSVLVLLSVSTSFAQNRDINQRLERLLDRCEQVTRTYADEAACYRNGIINIIGRQAYRVPQCVGVNTFGKYAEGGGCNTFGCYFAGGGCNTFGCYKPGGGCNTFGCYEAGGSCNTFGCIKPAASKASQLCRNN